MGNVPENVTGSSQLIVECPHCHTRFRIREAQLAVAGGQVRCGVCLALFDSGIAGAAETEEGAPAAADGADNASAVAASGPDGGHDDWRRLALLSVGMVVAAAALVFQLFAYQFDHWATEPQLRFIYEFACGVIGCELPPSES